MKSRITKHGKDGRIGLPNSLLAVAGLAIGQAVNIRVEDGCVVMEPLNQKSSELDRLLAQMTPETFPEDLDFGAPRGKEVW